MDRDRSSFLAHATLDYCSPLEASFIEPFYDAIPLPDGARLLDVGCGKSEVLLRLVERAIASGKSVSGAGVDAARVFVQESRDRAKARVPGAELEFTCVPTVRWPRPPDLFDVVAVVGATHAFGKPADAMRESRKLLKPGGFLLVGEAFVRADPDPSYLAALGVRPTDVLRPGELASIAQAGGFEVVMSGEVPRASFDKYESEYAANIERFVAANPSDRDGAWMLERARKWKQLYDAKGRENMGFSVVLAKAA